MEQRILDLKRNMSQCEPTQRHMEFVDSVHKYWIRNGRMSPSQVRYLESLEGTYSPEQIQAEKDWKEQYSDDHRDVACKIAEYYANQVEPYFNDIVRIVQADKEGHVLSQKQFTKMCMNKYSVKVLEEYSRNPRFSKGDVVEVKRTNRIDLCKWNERFVRSRLHQRNAIDGERLVGFVMDVNCKPITRAAKGSKIYQVLFVGESGPHYVHESDIKKAKV